LDASKQRKYSFGFFDKIRAGVEGLELGRKLGFKDY